MNVQPKTREQHRATCAAGCGAVQTGWATDDAAWARNLETGAWRQPPGQVIVLEAGPGRMPPLRQAADQLAVGLLFELVDKPVVVPPSSVVLMPLVPVRRLPDLGPMLSKLGASVRTVDLSAGGEWCCSVTCLTTFVRRVVGEGGRHVIEASAWLTRDRSDSTDPARWDQEQARQREQAAVAAPSPVDDWHERRARLRGHFDRQESARAQRLQSRADARQALVAERDRRNAELAQATAAPVSAPVGQPSGDATFVCGWQGCGAGSGGNAVVGIPRRVVAEGVSSVAAYLGRAGWAFDLATGAAWCSAICRTQGQRGPTVVLDERAANHSGRPYGGRRESHADAMYREIHGHARGEAPTMPTPTMPTPSMPTAGAAAPRATRRSVRGDGT